MLRDVVELRDNKWVPRREGQPTSNDDWITTGKGGKSVPIDQNKLRNMAKVRY